MASWDMFRELDNLRREIDDAFRSFGGSRPLSGFLTPVSPRRFPLINLSEDEGHVYLDALLPGVDPAGIDLSVLRNTVTISGERKPPAEEKGQVVHRSELGFGRFSRTIEVPVEVDSENVTAEYRDGVMRLKFGKPESAKPKKIEIKPS
ncbi:Hsp20/alpha crystallin family protein [Geobacter sp. DSM 9736]|uniref:Hsp20/alpha crystallin family protein n=1 Tax=Geobacter sp. DSM 9736 TaxID=1277350 RepID=UPI000B50AB5E|nr:Hsp20/alpha crystallin family protein [Geobacter sp. DSM 9736]SNB46063.1 HSP20 family protein [Geobacter sp. DSM 9736]